MTTSSHTGYEAATGPPSAARGRRWEGARSGTQRLAFAGCVLLPALGVFGAQPMHRATILEVSPPRGQQATVLYQRAGSPSQVPAVRGMPLYSGDEVYTRFGGWAIIERIGVPQTVRMEPMRELQHLTILDGESGAWIRFLKGVFCLFSRDVPAPSIFEAPNNVAGGHLNTEYEIRVTDEGTRATLIEGQLRLSNPHGFIDLTQPFQTALVPVDGAPRLVTTNIVQWWVPYPGILDVTELKLDGEWPGLPMASIEAYRTGDLLSAVRTFPEVPHPIRHPGVASYRAALDLVRGDLSSAMDLYHAFPGDPRMEAVGRAVFALSGQGGVHTNPPRTSSQWLAESYAFQASRDLPSALRAATNAVAISPEFGFAWSRIAELYFMMGNTVAARPAAAMALRHSPRNAHAMVLEGFLHAAQNRLSRAADSFEQAIALDPRLGTAWLGRGLCHIRRGDLEAGLADLRVAVAIEPTHSLLHSYLGKALADAGETPIARRELDRAQSLDARDPTPRLYGALLAYRENRINEAIRELERSIGLNDNRALYRSEFKLDEDEAVRRTGLARIYRRAGLTDPSLREAARAVAIDHMDYSAHLFLAESFDALRDPTRFNLRQETAWFNELLLANWLAPVGAGVLSPNISSHEYTRLFERNRASLVSFTELRSDGQWREQATQAGTFGGTSWSLDLDFHYRDGDSAHGDLQRIEWYSQVKQQVGSRDTALLLLKVQDFSAGDQFQYAEPGQERPGFRFDEDQLPIVVGGWRHEWSPESQTLLLGGWLQNEQGFTDDPTTAPTLELLRGVPKRVVAYPGFSTAEAGEFDGYTLEASHLLRLSDHLLTAGARVQVGEFDIRASQDSTNTLNQIIFRPELPALTSIGEDFSRFSLYAYDHWSPWENLTLIGGITLEDLRYPATIRTPPLADGSEERSRILPKAGLVWNVMSNFALRGVYARTLGGVTLDQSYRLEPVQIAGFTQDYRTIIPESVIGSVSAHDLELAGLALDWKFPTGTYAGLNAQLLRSDVDQSHGVLVVNFDPTAHGEEPSTVREEINYRELSLGGSLDQLLGDQWTVGVGYRFVDTDFDHEYPITGQSFSRSADLHELRLRARWNHRRGWFAALESLFLWQESIDSKRVPLDRSLTQIQAQIGLRFARDRGEVSIGALNLLDDDERLDPLSGYAELPDQLVVFGQLRLGF